MANGVLQLRTADLILQTMINIVVTRTNLDDLLDGSVWLQVLAACARSDETIYYQLARILTAFNINTATGSDLQKRARDYNVDIPVPGRSQGLVEFTRTGIVGSETVPQGTRVTRGDIEYQTLQDAIFLVGNTTSGQVAALAIEFGNDGDAPTGTVTTIASAVGINGLTVNNVTPMQGGRDELTNQQVRDLIKATVRNLNRTAPDALEAIALLTELATGERVQTASNVEHAAIRSRSDLYVDNGTGVTETTGTVGDGGVTAGLGEFLISTATGGEMRTQVQNPPIRRDAVTDAVNLVVLRNGGVLTEGVDYHVQSGTGKIDLDSTAFPLGLTAGDTLEAHYTYWSGLLQEVQWRIDGRTDNSNVYPGGRAAGARVYVRPPTVITPSLQMTVTVAQGYDPATVRATSRDTIVEHVNDNGIGDDVIIAELVDRVMGIAGVDNVPIAGLLPSADIPIGDDQISRVGDADVTIL